MGLDLVLDYVAHGIQLVCIGVHNGVLAVDCRSSALRSAFFSHVWVCLGIGLNGGQAQWTKLALKKLEQTRGGLG